MPREPVEWLLWVESSKAHRDAGLHEGEHGEPVPCQACSDDLRYREASLDSLEVACGCGAVASRHDLEDYCGGRLAALRRTPLTVDLLSVRRAEVEKRSRLRRLSKK